MASPFFGGMAKTMLKSWEARDADKRDVEKYKALEQLRRETSDYEFQRRVMYDAMQPDNQMSYIDDDTGEKVFVNNQGKEIRRTKLTDTQIRERATEREKDKLDLDYKKGQIENFAADNARADRQLDLQAAGLAESRADRALRREQMGRELEAAGGSKAPVYAKMNKVISNINSLEISPTQKAAARLRLTEAVNAGKGSQWIDKFEEAFYRDVVKSGRIEKYGMDKQKDEIFWSIKKENAEL